MESHLLQMRGLKQMVESTMLIGMNVASFTDAWIETGSGATIGIVSHVASFTDAWIETSS